MLDQLVESKNNSPENKRKGALFATLLAVAVLTLLAGTTYSLFGKDYGMGTGDLELTSLVAPPPPDETPPDKEEKQPEKKQAPDVDIRKELIQNIMSSPVKPPDKIDTTSNKVVAMRDNVKTMKGDTDVTNPNAVTERGIGAVAGTTNTFGSSDTSKGTTGGDDEPPPSAKPTPKPVPKTISGGVLNGKAIALPKPAYPAAARAVHASGTVTVQVLIDESGHVVSASAAGGHPLLIPAALAAARGARFSPTLLSGQPVKVSGVISYNFSQ